MINQETGKIKEQKEMSNNILLEGISLKPIFGLAGASKDMSCSYFLCNLKEEDKLKIKKIIIDSYLKENEISEKYYRTLFNYDNIEEILNLFKSFSFYQNKLVDIYDEDPILRKSKQESEIYLMYIFLYYINSNSYSPADKKNVIEYIKELYTILKQNQKDNPATEKTDIIRKEINDTKTSINTLEKNGYNINELEMSFYRNIDRIISNLPIILYQTIDNLSDNKKMIKQK